MNRKYFVNGKWLKCSEDGCESDAGVKGMCDRHYRIAYHYKTYVSVKKPNKTYSSAKMPKKIYAMKKRRLCSIGGCSVKTSGEYCSVHTAQMRTHGFAWVGKRPAEKIRAAREAKKKDCAVTYCENKVSSKVVLCNTHQLSRRRKSLSVETFLSMLEAKACDACGREKDRLVFDHVHAHHEKLDQMCELCIRGMLCQTCNTVLGSLDEDVERVRALERYLLRTARGF